MNALAIFAKAPVVGQVKTRLCPPLTPEQAAELYRCFLLDILENVSVLPGVDIFLAFTPVGAAAIFQPFLSQRVRLIPQRGDSLGERMANTLADLLTDGFKRVAIIGSDLPTLPVSYLQEAFRLLDNENTDVVLGPSADGGYYLIGARTLYPPLFAGVTWSTPTVLCQTCSRAQSLGLRVAFVPPWYDVDTKDDLRRLAADFASPARCSPRTRRFLQHVGVSS
jgi:rSAM/selenodomain-associated transferase 1